LIETCTKELLNASQVHYLNKISGLSMPG
jgi:hypothetical protein